MVVHKVWQVPPPKTVSLWTFQVVISKWFLLMCSWFTIIYMFLVYIIVIHNFEGYTPFIVIIKHWVYPLCCTTYPIAYYFINTCLYLLIPYPSVAPFLLRSPQWELRVCSLYLWVCFFFFLSLYSLVFYF